MLNINLTDKVAVIERDPVKLDTAIRTALAEAREVVRAHYLPEFAEVPPVENRVSTGHRPDPNKNGAQVVYHCLTPPVAVTLLKEYVELVDAIQCLPARDYVPVELMSQLVFGDADKLKRWTKNDLYKVVLRNAFRALFVSLLRLRAVLLPPSMERYLPIEQGVWRGFELMPERLKHMSAVYYAGSGLDYGIDWSLCNYSWKGASINKNGIENVPARTGKRLLVCMAMCTRWERLEEIDKSDIQDLKKLAQTNTIGLYMTYFYLRSTNQGQLSKDIFHWVESIPQLRIYTEHYYDYAVKAKGRRSYLRRADSGKTSEYDQTVRHPDADRRPLSECIAEAINEAKTVSGIDAEKLALLLGNTKGRSTLVPVSSDWPSETVLPDYVAFEWKRQSERWLEAFNIYARMTRYAEVRKEFKGFAPFMHYLMVYLPLYFHFNPNSQASYPSKIDDLNGFYFVSRLINPEGMILPMPFDQFVRRYYNDKNPCRVYTAMRKLHHFYETVLGRRELLGIIDGFRNPVLLTDIPSPGGRPTKTTKERLPGKAYWLSLAYAYKIYDYVSAINEKCLEDADYARAYNKLYYNLDEDELGMIDIRELPGIKIDRTIKFNGADDNVNLVPSYFLCPVELPIKNKGNIFVLRPHAIIHLICTLETGIRNQHIQWLSCDFDKYISADHVLTEDVYELFVNTDKSNMSWPSITSGRVIKILKEMKIFRSLVDSDAFDEDVYYEDRVENAVFSPFKPLFAYDQRNGNPHSDCVYIRGFRYLLAGLQNLLDVFGIDFRLFEYDPTATDRYLRIKTKFTPHSMRVTVVSEYTRALPSEYVGKCMTNQKLATVWYYTKYDAEQLRNCQKQQKITLSQYNRETSEVRLIGSGGVTIDATDPNSKLARAFTENEKQAVWDFGAVSSRFFDRETGIDMVLSDRKHILAFETTHICPFNRICPADRHKAGYANRCYFCDYAIRTVDHLPALACRLRDLIEEIDRLEKFVEDNGEAITEKQFLLIDKKRNIIAEDIGGIDLAMKILNKNLLRLQSGEGGEDIHVYEPEAILAKLEAMPFPDAADENRYLLARLTEIQAYPEEARETIRMKLLAMRNSYLANTCNIRESLPEWCEIDSIEAQVYSLVNGLRRVYGLTLDQVAEIAGRNIGEYIPLGHQSPFSLPGGAVEDEELDRT